ncbi:hypothetical protein RFI_21792, partial [Reticulomyxa filosa]
EIIHCRQEKMVNPRIFSIPTVLMATLSICSCGYVCNSSWEYRKKPKTCQRNSLFVENIFLMSLCDGANALWCVLNWLPGALTIFNTSKDSLWTYDETTCKILGIFSQLAGTSSPLWHVLIALSLFYLMLGYPLPALIRHKNKLYIAIIMTGLEQRTNKANAKTIATNNSVILTIIPLFFDAYGSFANLPNDNECWIKKKNYQMTEYIPVLFSVAFHDTVTLIVAIKYYRHKYKHQQDNDQCFISPETDYNRILVNNMTAFVCVFTLIRAFPTVDRIYGLTSNNTPSWLVFLHHVCIASVGLGDGLVWYYSNRNRQHSNFSDQTRVNEEAANSQKTATSNIDPQNTHSHHSTDSDSTSSETGSNMLSSVYTTSPV